MLIENGIILSDFVAKISVQEFQKTLATKLRPDPDVRKWTFEGYVKYSITLIYHLLTFNLQRRRK